MVLDLSVSSLSCALEMFEKYMWCSASHNIGHVIYAFLTQQNIDFSNPHTIDISQHSGQ